ncbi:MAG: hypothetical protein LH603_20495 [Pseudonocardia sp.]|nr:hypothetical protein [Pseudonocardia sp.]
MLAWSAGFLAFPIAGLAGGAVAGRVDDPVPALTGGLVSGLVIGAGQAFASWRRIDARRWIPATAAGMGIGLVIGATAVGFGTDLGRLALMGALTGVPLGMAQALALPRGTRGRWILGRGAATALGAGLDRHHAARHRRRVAVHELRRVGRHHVRGALGPPARTPAPGRQPPRRPRARRWTATSRPR